MDGTMLSLRHEITSICASVIIFLGLFRASFRNMSDIIEVLEVLDNIYIIFRILTYRFKVNYFFS